MRARHTAYVLIASSCIASTAHAQDDHARSYPLPSPELLDNWSDALASWTPSSFADALATGDASANVCVVDGAQWTCDEVQWAVTRDDTTWVIRATSVTHEAEGEITWRGVGGRGDDETFSADLLRSSPSGGRDASKLRWEHGGLTVEVVSARGSRAGWTLEQLRWTSEGGSSTAASATAASTRHPAGVWSLSGFGWLNDFDTSASSVGGLVPPTTRYLAGGPLEFEGSYVLGSSSLAATAWIAPTSHYGVGLSVLSMPSVTTQDTPFVAGLLVTQDGEVGVTTQGGWQLGSAREHVSGLVESDTTGRTMGVRRVARRAMFRDTLRRTAGAQASGAGHALRLWATSEDGPGTPSEDHGRAILDASLRLGSGEHAWTDVSLRSEVATREDLEHVTDLNIALGVRTGSRGAWFAEAALSPNLSVDVTRYPNGLTSTSHGVLAMDARAGVDVTGRWEGGSHRLRPTLRVALATLRFGDVEPGTRLRRDRLTGIYVLPTAIAQTSLEQDWSFGPWNVRVPMSAWMGASPGDEDSAAIGGNAGLEIETPLIAFDAKVFLGRGIVTGDVDVTHDARVTANISSKHVLALWSSDARTQDIQRLRWERSPLGGLAALSSVEHVASVGRTSGSDDRTRLGASWALGSVASSRLDLSASGYVGLESSDASTGGSEWGAFGDVSWDQSAEGIALGGSVGFSRLSGVDTLIAQLGLTWALQ